MNQKKKLWALMLTVTSRKRALKGYDVSEANPVMCLSCQVSSLNLIKKKKKQRQQLDAML